jgi:hypothetical protein
MFLGDTMRRLCPLLASFAMAAAAQVPDTSTVQQLADRTAIHEVMQKYVWSVDSLDADGYVAVFTEDAQIDSNGALIKGHAAIRKVVTDMQARQAANRAEGKPPGALYHVISNERITLLGPTEAVYYSYWQTMRKGEGNRYAAGGFGRSEDHLTKRNGQWLIKFRKLTVFTD